MPTTIITFESARMVIKADTLLRQQNVYCKIIPVPEHISSECGMCIETNIGNHELICNLLSQQQIKHTITVLQST